jgi:enterochelin esterase-like enzyme
MGASHGGLAAFYTSLANPTSFGIAGCMSSSFGAGLDFGGNGGSLEDSPLIQVSNND